MKKVVVLLAALMITLTGMSQIKWEYGTVDHAIEKAKKENKKVLLLYSAVW